MNEFPTLGFCFISLTSFSSFPPTRQKLSIPVDVHVGSYRMLPGAICTSLYTHAFQFHMHPRCGLYISTLHEMPNILSPLALYV
jgi:hypothetical protein